MSTCTDRLYTSESDVYRLTYKDGPHAERVYGVVSMIIIKITFASTCTSNCCSVLNNLKFWDKEHTVIMYLH